MGTKAKNLITKTISVVAALTLAVTLIPAAAITPLEDAFAANADQAQSANLGDAGSAGSADVSSNSADDAASAASATASTSVSLKGIEDPSNSNDPRANRINQTAQLETEDSDNPSNSEAANGEASKGDDSTQPGDAQNAATENGATDNPNMTEGAESLETDEADKTDETDEVQKPEELVSIETVLTEKATTYAVVNGITYTLDDAVGEATVTLFDKQDGLTSSITIPDEIETAGSIYKVTQINIPEDSFAIDYSMTIAPYATEIFGESIKTSGIEHLTIGANVSNINPAFLQLLPDLETIDVDPANANYQSTGAILFTKDGVMTGVAENAATPIVIPAQATDLEPGVFARAKNATAFEVDQASQTFTAHQALLYARDDTMLVATASAAGASVELLPTTTKIMPGTFIGNEELSTIIASDKVETIATPQQQTVTKGIIGGSPVEVDEYTALGAFAPERSASITALLPVTADRAPWENAGITKFSQAPKVGEVIAPPEGQAGFVYTVLEGYTLSVGWQGDTASTYVALPSKAEIAGASYNVTSIAANGFANVVGMTVVDVPAGIVSIGDGAFAGAPDLKTVHLEKGLQAIGARAFADTQLLSLAIPKTVASVGDQALANMHDANLVVLGDVAPSATVLEGATNVTIYAPNATIDTWRALQGVPASNNHVCAYEIGAAKYTKDAPYLVPKDSEIALSDITNIIAEGDVATNWRYYAENISVNTDTQSVHAINETSKGQPSLIDASLSVDVPEVAVAALINETVPVAEGGAAPYRYAVAGIAVPQTQQEVIETSNEVTVADAKPVTALSVTANEVVTTNVYLMDESVTPEGLAEEGLTAADYNDAVVEGVQAEVIEKRKADDDQEYVYKLRLPAGFKIDVPWAWDELEQIQAITTSWAGDSEQYTSGEQGDLRIEKNADGHWAINVVNDGAVAFARVKGEDPQQVWLSISEASSTYATKEVWIQTAGGLSSSNLWLAEKKSGDGIPDEGESENVTFTSLNDYTSKALAISTDRILLYLSVDFEPGEPSFGIGQAPQNYPWYNEYVISSSNSEVKYAPVFLAMAEGGAFTGPKQTTIGNYKGFTEPCHYNWSDLSSQYSALYVCPSSWLPPMRKVTVNGRATASGPGQYREGYTANFTLTADKGYVITDIRVTSPSGLSGWTDMTGLNVSSQNVSFKMPTGNNVVIDVTTAPKLDPTVTFEGLSNGSTGAPVYGTPVTANVLGLPSDMDTVYSWYIGSASESLAGAGQTFTPGKEAFDATNNGASKEIYLVVSDASGKYLASDPIKVGDDVVQKKTVIMSGGEIVDESTGGNLNAYSCARAKNVNFSGFVWDDESYYSYRAMEYNYEFFFEDKDGRLGAEPWYSTSTHQGDMFCSSVKEMHSISVSEGRVVVKVTAKSWYYDFRIDGADPSSPLTIYSNYIEKCHVNLSLASNHTPKIGHSFGPYIRLKDPRDDSTEYDNHVKASLLYYIKKGDSLVHLSTQTFEQESDCSDIHSDLGLMPQDAIGGEIYVEVAGSGDSFYFEDSFTFSVSPGNGGVSIETDAIKGMQGSGGTVPKVNDILSVDESKLRAWLYINGYKDQSGVTYSYSWNYSGGKAVNSSTYKVPVGAFGEAITLTVSVSSITGVILDAYTISSGSLSTGNTVKDVKVYFRAGDGVFKDNVEGVSDDKKTITRTFEYANSDSKYTVLKAADVLVDPTGKTFAKWTSGANGEVGDGASVKLPQYGDAVTANFTANVITYTLNSNYFESETDATGQPVTYDTNNIAGTTVIYVRYGEGVYSDAACTNALDGGKITVPVLRGYTFGGYFDRTAPAASSAVEGTQYIGTDGTVPMSGGADILTAYGSGPHPLYAKWTSKSVFEITLNDRANGAESFGERISTTDTTVYTGTVWFWEGVGWSKVGVGLPQELPTATKIYSKMPSKKYNVACGFFANGVTDNAQRLSNEGALLAAPLTMTSAETWSVGFAPKQYTVKYTGEGGTLPQDLVMATGAAPTDTFATYADASYAGHGLLGWDFGDNRFDAGSSIAAAFDTLFPNDLDDFNASRTATVTAQWAKVYTISLNAGDGTQGTPTNLYWWNEGIGYRSSDVDRAAVLDDGKVYVSSSNMPQKTNFNTLGLFSTAGDGDGVMYIDADGVLTDDAIALTEADFNVAGGIAWYARYEQASDAPGITRIELEPGEHVTSGGNNNPIFWYVDPAGTAAGVYTSSSTDTTKVIDNDYTVFAAGNFPTTEIGYKFAGVYDGAGNEIVGANGVMDKAALSIAYTGDWTIKAVPITFTIVYKYDNAEIMRTLVAYESDANLPDSAWAEAWGGMPDGQEAAGWRRDIAGSSPVIYNMGVGASTLTTEDDSEVVLTLVTQGKEVAWTIEHKLQNVDGSGYTVAETETGTRRVGDIIKASNKFFVGYNYAEGSNIPSKREFTLVWDETDPANANRFEVMYDRIECKVRFDKGGETSVTDWPDPDTMTVPYGGHVPRPKDPSTTGKNFNGWLTMDGSNYVAFDFENTTVTSDIIIVASWTNKDVAYKTVYFFEQVTDDPSKIEYKEDLTGQYVNSVPGQWTVETKYADNNETVTAAGISANGFELDTAHHPSGQLPNMTVTTSGTNILEVYYKRQIFDVSYSWDGKVPDPTYHSLTKPANTACKFGFTFDIPEKPETYGYKFNNGGGWIAKGASNAAVIVTDGKITMPAEDVVFSGTWAPKTYTVVLAAGNATTQGEKTSISVTFDDPSSIVGIGNDSSKYPKRSGGYTFAGYWTRVDGKHHTQFITENGGVADEFELAFSSDAGAEPGAEVLTLYPAWNAEFSVTTPVSVTFNFNTKGKTASSAVSSAFKSIVSNTPAELTVDQIDIGDLDTTYAEGIFESGNMGDTKIKLTPAVGSVKRPSVIANFTTANTVTGGLLESAFGIASNGTLGVHYNLELSDSALNAMKDVGAAGGVDLSDDANAGFNTITMAYKFRDGIGLVD